ncbi:MAG TPA: LysR family transcriptional regulator [Microlunatus sp.]
MTVDLRQLRALTAVVDEGTFTDAAITLRTSQASVSRAVAELERVLGARLLLRTSQGARPTVLGRRVTEHARRVLAEIALIERLADHRPAHLRVGFAWSVFGRLTTPIRRQWQAEHGAVTFAQSNTPTAGLLEGEVDLAVVRRPLRDQRFETSLVGAEVRYAALAADDPLARRRRLTLDDLSRRPIAIDRATGTTSTELWPTGAAPTEVHEVHGMEEWLTVVAAGEAVGITSEATAHQFQRPGLRYRPVVDAPPIAVWLVWWRDDPPVGAAAFRQLVCERYAERP